MEAASLIIALLGFLLTVYLEWPRICARLGRNQGVQAVATEQLAVTSRLVNRADITNTQGKPTGFFRSLSALLIGGLIPAFIIATYGAFLISETFGGLLFFLAAILGMIWGVTTLRHRSWLSIVGFAGMGAVVYVISIMLLNILGFTH